ncbi:hypothetical protein KUTeg_014901, partial [Tegillarca granosa]
MFLIDKIFPVDRTSPSFQELEKEFPFLQIGGRYKPPDCIARHRVAIIVPYRNREENLKVFLKNLHPFLQSQQLDYGVVVLTKEQYKKVNGFSNLFFGWGGEDDDFYQ